MDAIVAPPRGGLVNCVAAVGQSNCVLQELLKQAEDIGCLRLEGNLTRVFIGLVRHITLCSRQNHAMMTCRRRSLRHPVYSSFPELDISVEPGLAIEIMFKAVEDTIRTRILHEPG